LVARVYGEIGACLLHPSAMVEVAGHAAARAHRVSATTGAQSPGRC
jgi:hypothetical protein